MSGSILAKLSLTTESISGAGQYFGASPLKDGGFVALTRIRNILGAFTISGLRLTAKRLAMRFS